MDPSIQILDAKEGAGPAGKATTIARVRRQDLADIGRRHEAEALLICPAPEEFVSEGCDLVVAARFPHDFDEDRVFWKQHELAGEFHHALALKVLVLDLDNALDRFLKYIEPMLISPYRDELGRRDRVSADL